MGTRTGEEVDSWLRSGGLVVTSSDRSARAFEAAHHSLRRGEGLSAWPMPAIADWKDFARSVWDAHFADGRLLMNAVQEQALWAGIIRDEKQLATTLDASIQRLAALAAEAHQLLCFYSPHHLLPLARGGWDRDAGRFSDWLTTFDHLCAKQNLLSANRMPRELIAKLQADRSIRPSLLAAGFDRLLPVQREIFDAWGQWRIFGNDDKTPLLSFDTFPDSRAELEACALWCNRRLAANPECRLLVITQDIASRRGEIERAFLYFSRHVPNFEFSLGIPLARIPAAHEARLLLRWLHGVVTEAELDWLISSRLTADPAESAALESCMRVLRHKGLQRTQWTLTAFVDQAAVSARLPQSWVRRMIAAQRLLRDLGGKPRNPIDWVESVPHLLQTMRWPGELAEDSADYQAIRRWEQALDAVGSLGFDGRRIDWMNFLAALERTLSDTVFAPESLNAPIQIAGPAESAGLTADGIWFLGASESSWPAVGSMHPFLPPEIQRSTEMPHGSPLLDWKLSSAITERLIRSATEVHFSYARQVEGVEASPSRLIAKLPRSARDSEPGMMPPQPGPPVAKVIADSSRVPFRRESAHGGARVITSQSQCPFKAFAVARLGAEGWSPAEAGLTPGQRGQILHAILHSVWSGPPDGLRTLDDLLHLEDRSAFVQGHIDRALQNALPASVIERMPRKYLGLERIRLKQIVIEWLAYEAERIAFLVEGTEVDRTIPLAGLVLKLRIDRIDRLRDGSLLVIDYKTGEVSPKAWDLPRPEDVQVPLYAGFALDESPGGLLYAKLRAWEWEFAGNVADARSTLLGSIPKGKPLAKDPLTPKMMQEWKAAIEKLARDFVEGHAEADPRDYPTTCERCGLQAVCRIQEPENQARLTATRDADSEEDADE